MILSCSLSSSVPEDLASIAASQQAFLEAVRLSSHHLIFGLWHTVCLVYFFHKLMIRSVIDFASLSHMTWLDYHGSLVWRTTEDIKCRDHLSATYNDKGHTHAKKDAADRVDTVLITGPDATNNRHIGLFLGRPVRVCD